MMMYILYNINYIAAWLATLETTCAAPPTAKQSQIPRASLRHSLRAWHDSYAALSLPVAFISPTDR